jgi:hypothetical protein
MANHPITPPPELVQQWVENWHSTPRLSDCRYEYIATQSARWGADHELEACIDVLGGQWEWDILSQCTGWKDFRNQSEEILRAARRPKPPSLKEQALTALHAVATGANHTREQHQDLDTIRKALEALPND